MKYWKVKILNKSKVWSRHGKRKGRVEIARIMDRLHSHHGHQTKWFGSVRELMQANGR